MQKEDIRVGDVLKIRQWDDMADEFGTLDLMGSIYIKVDQSFFVPAMKYLCGKIFTVKKIFVTPYYNIESEEGIELEKPAWGGLSLPVC